MKGVLDPDCVTRLNSVDLMRVVAGRLDAGNLFE
jgi:hypothetical protein